MDATESLPTYLPERQVSNRMSSSGYIVKTEVFEGPFDLLLQLIEKRKLFINDLSLAQVTDSYLAHIKEQKRSVGETANFILVASTLLLIKSKSLLPALELTDDEERSIEDLEYRLKLYKLFRDISIQVNMQFGKNPLFEGGERREKVIVFSPGNDISATSLILSLKQVLTAIPLKVFVPEAAIKKVVSLEATIEQLADRVTKAISISFRDFAGIDKNDKLQVVVSFLAMLELIKQGIINVTQSNRFDDITMESDDVSIPKY
ncbi:MAG: segregation/condensation protein A [Parcubacteria group bacterium]|nr:segregation/condensation protein A [Parcubacteria group bacterium]